MYLYMSPLKILPTDYYVSEATLHASVAFEMINTINIIFIEDISGRVSGHHWVVGQWTEDDFCLQ